MEQHLGAERARNAHAFVGGRAAERRFIDEYQDAVVGRGSGHGEALRVM